MHAAFQIDVVQPLQQEKWPATIQRVLLSDLDRVIRKEEHESKWPLLKNRP